MSHRRKYGGKHGGSPEKRLREEKQRRAAQERAIRRQQRTALERFEETSVARQRSTPHPIDVIRKVRIVDLFRKGSKKNALEKLLWSTIMSLEEYNPKVVKPLHPDMRNRAVESVFAQHRVPEFIHRMFARHFPPAEIMHEILLYHLLVHGATYNELRERGYDHSEIISCYEETPQYDTHIHAKRKK